MACILDKPRYATVVSIGRCKVKRYPGEKLKELIEKYPDISIHLFKTMARRLRKTGRILIQLAGGARSGAKPQAIRQA
jgi:type IV pilus assembly protein PilB